jgi:hypothetical protein
MIRQTIKIKSYLAKCGIEMIFEIAKVPKIRTGNKQETA